MIIPCRYRSPPEWWSACYERCEPRTASAVRAPRRTSSCEATACHRTPMPSPRSSYESHCCKDPKKVEILFQKKISYIDQKIHEFFFKTDEKAVVVPLILQLFNKRNKLPFSKLSSRNRLDVAVDTCSVSDHPLVCECVRSMRHLSLFGLKRSFTRSAQRRRAARIFAISWNCGHNHRTLICCLKIKY